MTMNKRLRKKKHRGEFQELGFAVRFRFTAGLAAEARNRLLDDWIAQAIEDNDLVFGGGGGDDEWEGFVTVDEGGSATEAHRESVARWLQANPLVVDHTVSALVDAWYGDAGSSSASTRDHGLVVLSG
jgi:hypothetical protein